MKRLVQSVGGGDLRHADVLRLAAQPTELLVEVRSSLISSGTERSMHKLAGSSLAEKARARPDLVRTVVDRARRDGIRSTVRAVRSRLDEDMPVGYSAAGVVTDVGVAVTGFRPGDRVVTAGVGHAELQAVPGNLAAKLPDEVSFDEGAFGAIASVALHALRLADVGPGAKVAVIGLGLIGQLAVRLALAAGCDVAGTDLDDRKLAVAEKSGAMCFAGSDDGIAAVVDWTGGRGADAVIVTAATKSSGPMNTAANLARDRATIVAVGDVGLDLDRRPLYEKELTVKVSRAYGPGRYDPVYEEFGIDYPIGFVRWPIGRNLEAVVGLIASGRLVVDDLVTHRFPFDRAADAYDVFEGDDAYLGILLEYDENADQAIRSVHLSRNTTGEARATGLSSGLIGAGRFAAGVLLPAAIDAGFGPWTSIASSDGSSAARLGSEYGFAEVVPDAAAVIDSNDAGVVFVASRHDSHASIVAAALEAGKDVFCEKPLALSDEELDTVIDAWNRSRGVLMAGFNRRWSPAVIEASAFIGGGGPLQIIYRVHAGALPADHWLKDRRQGGRLLGEGCHFIDTCNAIVGHAPTSVYAMASGEAELLLREDFTIALNYADGSQATIVYSAGAPRGARKEWVEIIRGDRSAAIDDYQSLMLRSATATGTRRYRPADKGHKAELAAFRAAIEGRRDGEELTRFAVETSVAALAAIESLMSGSVVTTRWPSAQGMARR